MGDNICLKLSHLENVLVLDKVADVTLRSSHPGRGLWLNLRCIWFSPAAEKLDGAVSPLPPYRVCDLCNSFGLENREVSLLNQLYSKGTVCLCLNSLISKSRTISLQVEYIHRANILKVRCACSLFPTASTIFLVQKVAQNSFMLQNRKLHGKKY